MYVNPSEHIQQQLFWYSYYEKEAILTWEAFINKDFVVLDIGANAGYYSLVAAPRARKVYAFEPSTTSLAELTKNIRLNQFSNIEVCPYAVSAETGKGTLYISVADNSGMSGLEVPEIFSGITEVVATVSLDEWVSSSAIAAVDLIKIDVEGAEMNVLTGMKQLVQQYQPVIFIEIIGSLLDKFKHTPASIYQFLFSCNYSAYEIIKPGLLKQVTEPKEADSIIFLPRNYTIPAGVQLL